MNPNHSGSLPFPIPCSQLDTKPGMRATKILPPNASTTPRQRRAGNGNQSKVSQSFPFPASQKSSLRLPRCSPLLWHVTGHIVWLQLDPFPGVEVQLVEISAVNVASCSSKHVETPVDDGHGLAEKPERTWDTWGWRRGNSCSSKADVHQQKGSVLW